jgi:quercetin dioxygenase-like cupin family protein
MMHFKKGQTHNGHAHAFDHITLLATGSVTMKYDNGVNEYKAPYLIVTPKSIKHQFIAKEDNTVLCCIHAIRDENGVSAQDITEDEAWKLFSAYSVYEK